MIQSLAQYRADKIIKAQRRRKAFDLRILSKEDKQEYDRKIIQYRAGMNKLPSQAKQLEIFNSILNNENK